MRDSIVGAPERQMGVQGKVSDVACDLAALGWASRVVASAGVKIVFTGHFPKYGYDPGALAQFPLVPYSA